MSKKWNFKECPRCSTLFKPRGPKKYCSRNCKTRDFVDNKIATNRSMIEAIKLHKGCENPNCKWVGPFTPEMLDFDHINPKNKHSNIASLLSCKTERILEEILKCRVLCSNCHRQFTRKNWNAYQ